MSDELVPVPPEDPADWEYQTYHRGVISSLANDPFVLVRENASESLSWQVRIKSPGFYGGPTVLTETEGLDNAVAAVRFYAAAMRALSRWRGDAQKLGSLIALMDWEEPE